jgi:TolB-like protein
MIRAEPAAGRGIGLSPEDCRAQLALILNSADFDATGRERRFLSHVVEETLAGRGDRIKAYSIAVEVFGRDMSFDPQTDPIVRIEAGHLRRGLERYYLTAGHDDPILITIPKGGYVPTFSARSPPETVEPVLPVNWAEKVPTPPRWMRASWLTVTLAATVAALAVLALGLASGGVRPTSPEIPKLLVETFDDLSGTEASRAIASGLTQEIVGQLSKFKDVIVVQSSEDSVAPSRFVLAGSVHLSADSFRLRVRFINRADGSVLWADSYDGEIRVAALLETEANIAQKVATSLAQTYGVIFQADASLHVSNPPDDWAAYSCTLSFYAYRAKLDQKALPAVRGCLEKAVERFPGYATAWGLLSQAYIDEIRFLYPSDEVATSASIARALAAARRAVGLDPLNIRGLQAEMFALYFSKEIEAALSVGKRALIINPNDTELMGEYGYRLALSGGWDDGCPLVAEARTRNPGPLAYYETALALCAYFRGDYPQAAMWIRKATVPGNANYHTIAAAIFGEGGYEADARRERIWLEENAPGLINNLRQEVAMRIIRPVDVDFFLGSLKKAGLTFKDLAGQT